MSKRVYHYLLLSCFQHSWTALMEASQVGHDEIVKMLIEAGASLKQRKKVN